MQSKKRDHSTFASNALVFNVSPHTVAFLEKSGFNLYAIRFSPFLNSFVYESLGRNNIKINPSELSLRFDFVIARKLQNFSSLELKLFFYELFSSLAPEGTVLCQGGFAAEARDDFLDFFRNTFPAPLKRHLDLSKKFQSEVFSFQRAEKVASVFPADYPVPDFFAESARLKKRGSIEDLFAALLCDAAPNLKLLLNLLSAKMSSKRAAEQPPREEVSVSGVSVGLPNYGQKRSFFDDGNLERVLEGESCLSVLSDSEVTELIETQVVKVNKTQGGREKVRVDRPENMLKVVSRLGRFDLEQEFGVPRFLIEGMDKSTELAVGAGLKALQNANIAMENDGQHLFGIPPAMRDQMGVIFASSFGPMDSVVAAASDYTEHRVAMTNLPADAPSRWREGYEYDRKLLFKLVVPANCQLAQLTGARGPNTSITAACASTAQALAIASDWIRLGRCTRVLVVAADNTTSPRLLPLVGCGFVALGAACLKGDPQEAAVPFDRRRSGLILGMGAVGLVLESTSATAKRSLVPLAHVALSQMSNSAFHASLMAKEHIISEMERFVKTAETKLSISRAVLAREMIYMSHETSTSKDGGCAGAEMSALKKVFGKHFESILVTGVKGLTGHSMGANLEEAIAVAALESGRVPPVPNTVERDESLGNVQLSRGGEHSRRFVLRMAAGFGSQLVFLLYRKQLGSFCALI